MTLPPSRRRESKSAPLLAEPELLHHAWLSDMSSSVSVVPGATAPFSLRRSCRACIRAKDRCTRETPQCRRCTKDAVACVYDNQPLGKRAPQCTESQHGGSTLRKPCLLNATAQDTRTMNAGATPTLTTSACARGVEESPRHCSPCEMTLCLNSTAHSIDIRVDDLTLEFLARNVKRIPAAFVNLHSTPFIHAQLYQDAMPRSVADAWVTCQAFETLTASNAAHCWAAFDQRLRSLIESYPSLASVRLKLASCQAMLLFAILLTFNRSERFLWSSFHPAALISVLTRWTADLWKVAPAVLASEQGGAWETWIVAESLRRTILAALLVRAIFNTMSYGVTRHTLFFSSLPFDPRTWLWSVDSQSRLLPSAIAEVEKAVALASYREFTDGWRDHIFTINGPFESLLVAACKGRKAMILRQEF